MKRVFYHILVFFLFHGTLAYADYAMEHTQLANKEYLREVMNLTEDELSQLIAMLDDLQENSKRLSSHTWGDSLSQLQQLADISAKGDALAYSLMDISAHYREQMPGYEVYIQQLEDENTTSPINFSEQYERWIGVNQHSIEQSLLVLQAHHEAFEAENTQITSIRKQSEQATGRLAALQVANELFNQQLAQLQQLRQLMMTQIQLMANQSALQHDKMEWQYAREKTYYDPKNPIDIGAGKRYVMIKTQEQDN